MRIPIVTTYDGRGVRRAEGGLGSLISRSIAARLSIAAIGATILAIGKDSVAAAIEDQAAQANLAKQMQNMGFGSAAAAAGEFISKMQMATNVAEDELRPAFAKALRATDDLTASQELLGLSADIAKGANKDFGTVVSALTKAISGNRKGLLSLDTGMSKGYIASAKMSDIIGVLERKFGGSAADSVRMWDGQWKNLKKTLGEAEETIGTGMVTAFGILASEGGASMDGLTNKINTFAETTSNVFVGLAALSKDAQSTDPGNWFKLGFDKGKIATTLKLFGLGIALLEAKGILTKKLTKEQELESSRENHRTNALNKSNGKSLTTLKKVADAKSKVTTATKKSNTAAAKSLALARLAAKFDLELINIAAAKKHTQSMDTLSRLNAKELIARDAAGLPVSDAALNAANRAMTPIVINQYIAGSVITEGALHGYISDAVKEQQLRGGGYGKWGGGL